MDAKTISPDNPALYLTAIAHNRLPVFRTARLKEIVCAALDEARRSGGFALFAYVVMLDHLHIVTDLSRKPSEITRFIKGICSRRVIDYLKQGGFEASLKKLQHENWERRHRYSLWQLHSNAVLLTSETMLMQRVHYIHQNPVRAGLVERAEEYRWSSVRCWLKRELPDEPLRMDLDRIRWRSAAGRA